MVLAVDNQAAEVAALRQQLQNIRSKKARIAAEIVQLRQALTNQTMAEIGDPLKNAAQESGALAAEGTMPQGPVNSNIWKGSQEKGPFGVITEKIRGNPEDFSPTDFALVAPIFAGKLDDRSMKLAANVMRGILSAPTGMIAMLESNPLPGLIDFVGRYAKLMNGWNPTEQQAAFDKTVKALEETPVEEIGMLIGLATAPKMIARGAKSFMEKPVEAAPEPPPIPEAATPKPAPEPVVKPPKAEVPVEPDIQLDAIRNMSAGQLRDELLSMGTFTAEEIAAMPRARVAYYVSGGRLGVESPKVKPPVSVNDPQAIASELGVRYEGVQERVDKPSVHQFAITEPGKETSFYSEELTPEAVKAARDRKLEEYAAANPKPELVTKDQENAKFDSMRDQWLDNLKAGDEVWIQLPKHKKPHSAKIVSSIEDPNSGKPTRYEVAVGQERVVVRRNSIQMPKRQAAIREYHNQFAELPEGQRAQVKRDATEFDRVLTKLDAVEPLVNPEAWQQEITNAQNTADYGTNASNQAVGIANFQKMLRTALEQQHGFTGLDNPVNRAVQLDKLKALVAETTKRIESGGGSKEYIAKEKSSIAELDLKEGDKVNMHGEWYRIEPSETPGNIKLKDGRTIDADLFDSFPITEVERAPLETAAEPGTSAGDKSGELPASERGVEKGYSNLNDEGQPRPVGDTPKKASADMFSEKPSKITEAISTNESEAPKLAGMESGMSLPSRGVSGYAAVGDSRTRARSQFDEFYDKNQGLKDQGSIVERAARKISNGFRQRFVTFEGLRTTKAVKKFYGDGREWLRQTMAVPKAALEQSAAAMRSITQDLSASEMDAVGRRVVVEDLMESMKAGEVLPEEITRAELEAQLPELVKAVDSNPRIKAAYERHRRLMDAVRDELIDRGKLDPERARENYYHHEAMKYLLEEPKVGVGKRLTKARRGYLKQRLGSKGGFNTDYLDVNYRLLSKVIRDNMVDDAVAKIASNYDLRSEQGMKKYLDMPDGEKPEYVFWSDKVGKLRKAKSATDQYVLDTVGSTIDEAAKALGIDAQILQQGLIEEGGKSYILPQELAYHLDNFRSDYINVEPSIGRRAMSSWKQVVLNKNPLRYNRRNMIGDAERMFNAIPQTSSASSFKMLRDKTLPDILDAVKGNFSADYRLALEKGVVSSGEVATEIGGVKDMPEFAHLYTQNKYRHFLRYVGKQLRDATTARENLLRLHTFYHNLERARAGKPLHEGISNLDGITDPIDQAAKISRETLGDYGDFTKYERDALRNRWIPFYSWMKINTSFWPQLMAKQGFKAFDLSSPGKAAGTALAVGRRAGWVLARATAVYAIVDLWNNTVQKDQEAELGEDLKHQFHFNTGMKDNNGNWITFTDPTALSDFFETIGAQGIGTDVSQLLRGEITIHDLMSSRVKEVLTSPVEKVLNGINPMIKGIAEALTDKRFFPHPLNPQTTDLNPWEKITQGAGIGEVASRRSAESFAADFIAPPFTNWTGLKAVDTEVGALYDSYKLFDKYNESKGIEKGFGKGAKTDQNRAYFHALVDPRMSHRVEDLKPKTEEDWKAFKEYLNARSPSEIIAKKDWPDFLESLNKRDRKILLRAALKFREIAGESNAEINNLEEFIWTIKNRNQEAK